MPSPRVLFFGYSEVGYATLELLLARGVDGRGRLHPHRRWPRNPLVPLRAQAAAERGLPVFTPDSLKDPAWVEKIRALRPDLILSMYYRNMIPTRLLDLAPLGAYNMHGSYLPRYRGRAPLNWAIIHGEDHTGVSLHVMVKEADAGDVVDQEKIPIGPDEPVSARAPPRARGRRQRAGPPTRRPARRPRPAHAPKPRPRHLFRQTHPRRWPPGLESPRPRGFQS